MSASPLVVSPGGLRRFLLDAQGLSGQTSDNATLATPARVLPVIRRLEAVQIDPVAVVERNHHLVLGARLPGYRPAMLERLRAQRRVFEYWANGACVIPIEDYPLFAGVRDRFRLSRQFLTRFGRLMDMILSRLAAEGPLPARAFEAGRRRLHWWWDKSAPRTKDTSYVLNYLWYSGGVTVVRRVGAERYFDLPEKAVPADIYRRAQQIAIAEANEALLEKYMRAYRVFNTRDGWNFSWRKTTAAERREIISQHLRSGTIVPLAIPAHRQYYVMAGDVDRLRRYDVEAQRTGRGIPDGPLYFLPPLDNLLWRRERLLDLFDFSYKWEIYDPPAKRRYGYYVMPILAGDQFIGRLDPRFDRERDRIVVQGLWFEPAVRVTKRLQTNLREALDAFARFHGASTWAVQRTVPRGLRL